MRNLKYIGLIFLIIGLINCGNHTSNNDSISNNDAKMVTNLEKNTNSLIEKQEPENKNQDFDGVLLNPELSTKFDSIKRLYDDYYQGQSIFDTLMIFQKNGRDTLIRKSEVTFLESFDPNAAFYLFKSDTIIGGNGYCSSDFYLLKDGELYKIISQYADCVESASSVRIEICLDPNGIKFFYLKDIEDVWDDQKFRQGFEGSETEIYSLFNSKKFQFGIQKSIIKCRSDMNLPDTLKFELVKYADFSYIIPEIKFGFEK